MNGNGHSFLIEFGNKTIKHVKHVKTVMPRSHAFERPPTDEPATDSYQLAPHTD